MTDSSASYLRCLAVSGENADTATPKNETLSESLHQEEGKKSSFLLNSKEPLTITKPAHLIIDCSPLSCNNGDPPLVYFLGGFQIVSNARHLEVYLTNKDGKEEYLMTSKGISFEKGISGGEDWYKAVCVVPGGPRATPGLHIKLLSLNPVAETQAKVKYFKLTARIPEIPTTAPKSEIPSAAHLLTENHQPMNGGSSPTSKMIPSSTSSKDANYNTGNGITQADLGAVMASLSILARTTESGIETSMNEKLGSLENLLQNRLTILEKHVATLASVAISQKTSLEEQTKLLMIQQTIMQAQSDEIKSLLEHHKSMTQMVKDLQTELSSFLRQRVSDNNVNVQVEPTGSTFLQESKDDQKIPFIAARPPNIDEEPIEGGIEQTLSNLEGGEDEENEGKVDSGTFTVDPIIASFKTAPQNKMPDPLEQIEKIEVSLLDGETESMHLVHEEKVEGPQEALDSPAGTSPSRTSTVGHAPKITQSFDDRNDKNDSKEAGEVDTPEKVELEVMADHEFDAAADDDDKLIKVLESTTADQHERSPPDVSDANLLDL